MIIPYKVVYRRLIILYSSITQSLSAKNSRASFNNTLFVNLHNKTEAIATAAHGSEAYVFDVGILCARTISVDIYPVIIIPLKVINHRITKI